MLAAAALGAAAPPAHAGSYTVFACGSYDNRSWNSVSDSRHQRRRALPGQHIDGQRGRRRRARPARRRRHHHLHRPGRDVDRRLHAHPPAHLPQRHTGRGHPPALRHLHARQHRVRRRGSLRQRDAQPPQRRRLLVRLSREQRRRAAGARSGARASRRSRATPAPPPRCRSRSAASTAASTPPARWSGSGGISHLLSGAQVVLNDPTVPAASIEASGLLAGGARSGSDVVTLDATDNGGIRRVEILDLTPSGASVVGAEDYAAGARTATGASLLVPPPQALPEPQERDRPPDPPGRRPADPEAADHRRRRQRDRAGPLRGQCRHAVGPRPAQRRRRDRGRQADRPLQRHHQDAPHRRLPLAGRHLGPPAELLRAADQRRRAAGPHARPAPGRGLGRALRDDHEVRRQLSREGARRRHAPDPDRLALAHERPGLPGERVRDPVRARVVVAERAAAGGRRRRRGCA